MSDVENSLPLGKPTRYQDQYDPSLLCPFPRQTKRDDIGITGQLPFDGFDLWTAYEVSWLNPKGKPMVALAEFFFPCTTPYLIESKSFKLYLNSYNQTPFADERAVVSRMTDDLSRVSGGKVDVHLFSIHTEAFGVEALPGICLDKLDIEVENYNFDANLLAGAADPSHYVTEELHSHLLKSNCLVTNQPDWGSVLIRYQGAQIDHEALLRYLISFRRHNEFHEQCVERIFVDLMRFCQPEKLTVYARYTRRGGLDINPFRSNFEQDVPRIRLVRQ